jgi:hypothetical protein
MDNEANKTASKLQGRQAGSGAVFGTTKHTDNDIESNDLESDSILDESPIGRLTAEQIEPAIPAGSSKPWRRIVGIGLVSCGLILMGILLLKSSAISHRQSTLNNSTQIRPKTFLLNDLSKQLGNLSSQATNTLNVNGQLYANDSVVISPTTKPSNAVPGQLYYDNNSNRLSYYDGKNFLTLQGGGNTFVTNNNITNTAGATTNITNVTNSGGGGVAGTTGTSGHIAMFTTANTIGNSLITQNGSNITTGNGVEDITLGSVTGGSTTDLQGGTAGVSILTGAQVGTSGGVTIQSGASSTLAAGNVVVDTGSSIITGTLVNTLTFESGLESMQDGFGFHDTLAQSTAQAHSGTHSLAITVGLGPLNAPQFEIVNSEPYFSLPVTSGHKYAFSTWVRAGTNSTTIDCNVIFSTNGFGGTGSPDTYLWGTVTDVSTGWKQVTGILNAPAGMNFATLEFASFISGSVGDVHYLDDMSMTDLTSSTSIADLSLGATNAQRVTLGNANEIGATSIYGGGISLDSGPGNFSINGGALTETSSTANLTTTGGGFAISSSGAATIQTGNLGGGGSALLLKTGDANGCGCNGGNLSILAGAGFNGGLGGTITIDNTQVNPANGTVVDTRNFETGTNNMTATLNDSVSQDNSASRSGSFSLNETSTVGGPWQVAQDQSQAGVPVTAGHSYYFDGWVRAKATSETINSTITWLGQGTIKLNSVTESGINWMHITGVGTAPAGTTDAYWNFDGNDPGGQTNYFDDLTVTDLSTSTGNATLNLGSSFIQGVNLGNQSQVAATNIQGGSGININSAESSLNLSGGTVSLRSADSTISSGDITIESGASSTTASGNITIDSGSGIVSGTVVDVRDFESGLQNIDAWYGDSAAVTNAQAHSGLQSLAETQTTGGGFWGIGGNENFPGVPVVPGHHYFFSGWVRADTTPNVINSGIRWVPGGNIIALSTVTDSTTGWTQITGSGVAPAGASNAYWLFTGSGQALGETHYFDDLVTTDLSSSSAVSELDLGASNAQIINIGNMNEIGATTIDGGSGITLNSGQGNFIVNGGAINVTGSGASLFQTTSGSLDITSASAATWQVNTAVSGTGGDLNIHAGNGAFGNNNGGNLILQAGTAGASGNGSGGFVEIGTGTGAVLGESGIGPFNNGGGGGPNAISASEFTTTSGGTITSMSAYLTGARPAPNNNFQFAIYSDNSGNPGNYITSSSIGTISPNSWNTLPISAVLAPSTTYWLVYWQNDDVNDSSNGDAYYPSVPGALTIQNTYTWQSGPDNGMPASWPAAGNLGFAGNLRSIYASYVSAGPALTIDSSGNLKQSGAVTLQDPANSSNAFLVQDSLGNQIFNIDTADQLISLDGNVQINLGAASNLGNTLQIISTGTEATLGLDETGNGGQLYQLLSTGTGSSGGVGNFAVYDKNTNNAPFLISSAGAATFHNSSDSTTAFQIQNSLSSPLLTADTTDMALTIGGHIITSGITPGVSAGAAANCSGTGSTSVTGNDTSGTITVTSGSGPCAASGLLATITFSTAYSSAPQIMLSPVNSNASTLQYYSGLSSANNFTVDTNTIPSAITTYKYNYWVVQ